jgi:hypothetical protein
MGEDVSEVEGFDGAKLARPLDYPTIGFHTDFRLNNSMCWSLNIFSLAKSDQKTGHSRRQYLRPGPSAILTMPFSVSFASR